MKHENIIYGLGSIFVITGAVMNILHVPYANPIFLFGLIWTTLFQTWHVIQLKKRVRELENKS
jgi:hypothetical protein